MNIFYIEDNVIQFSALSTNITAKQFAKYLYYFMNLHEDSNFINDIMDKFPLISLFELVDNPDNYMKDLGYFMETEFHYTMLPVLLQANIIIKSKHYHSYSY